MLPFKTIPVLFLSLMVHVAFSQADNYQKHKNDKQTEVSDKEMRFVIAFKSHFDIGYSSLARDVVHEYRTTMIDRALDIIDENQKASPGERFTWTVPGWPAAQMLWDRQDPQRRERIVKAIQKGNLAIHALPFTLHTATSELEELVRGLSYSSSVARQFDLPLPTDAKETDVPAHSWIMPTLMKHAGITFYHLGANPTNQFVKLPELFWWEGPDGSRVLTMFAKGYAGGIFPPDDWKFKTWLTLVHAGDNAGPPSAAEVKTIIQEIKTKFPKSKILVGRMADFAHLIMEEKPELPVVRGDMSDSWIHGPMSMPQEVKVSRRIKALQPALEVLSTQSTLWGIQHFSLANDSKMMYENGLRFSEHTWGLANQHFIPGQVRDKWYKNVAAGFDPTYQRMMESWREHGNFVIDAQQIFDTDMDNELQTLAENVNAKGRRIVVYNPLPWKRGGVVKFAFPFGGKIEASAVKSLDDNKIIPIKMAGEPAEKVFGQGTLESNRLGEFVAEDVPPYGYKTYVFVEGKLTNSLKGDEGLKTIENQFFKITFDTERSSLKSIIDKKNNKEMVNTKANGFGQYLYENYTRAEMEKYLSQYIFNEYKNSHYRITAKSAYLPDDLKHTNYSPKANLFSVDKSETCITGTLYPSTPDAANYNKHNAALTVTLYNDQPYIDMQLSVVNKPATEVPEAGWFCFPFAVNKPSFRLGTLGSVVDPAKDILEGSNFNYIWTNTGIAVLNSSNSGYGLCPLDAPAVALGKTGFDSFQPTWEPREGNVYLNLFNNKWNTNFQSFWGGNITSRVRLWAIDNFTNESLITPSLEARIPLLSGMANNDGGKLPVSKSGLTLSRKGVVVTAFGENVDGDGIVLRLWEMTGDASSVTVTLPEEMKVQRVTPISLRGEKLGAPLNNNGNVFEVKMAAYSPKSFLIE